MTTLPPLAVVAMLAVVLGGLLVLLLSRRASSATGSHRRERAEAALGSLADQVAGLHDGVPAPDADAADPVERAGSTAPVWDPMPSDAEAVVPLAPVAALPPVAPSDPGAAYDELASSLSHDDSPTAAALADLARLAATVRRGGPDTPASPTPAAPALRTLLPAVDADPVVHDEPAALRRRAAGLREEAHELAATDPAAARQACWEADLAAYDAVVIEAARRCGDTRLVSVRLRRRLALSVLGPHREPEALAATTTATLAGDVAGVRRLLTACLEPHERPALTHALGVVDLTPTTDRILERAS